MRKQVEIKIDAGRDAGKVFKVEEMPAVQMDRWVTRALCMLGRSGSGLSAIGGMTMEDLLAAFSKLDLKDSEPLLDELLGCCSFMKDGVLAGYGMIAKSFSTEYGVPCIWIEDIYLKPEFRNLGIGSQFFSFLEEQFPGHLFRLEVEEENTPAVHTYRKNGFTEMPYLEMKKGK